MGYSAKVLCDSESPDSARLTTMEVTIPRIVLAEFNTHRMFSRNSASSRAIPVEKQIEHVLHDPFIPIYWGKNQKGMQANVEISSSDAELAKSKWLFARDEAVESARSLLDIGIHKQITNRLLEPFMWHTIIVTATEWENFFALRCNPDAQPEIRRAAEMMRDEYTQSVPRYVELDEWHLPLMQKDEIALSAGSPEWNEPVGSSINMMLYDVAKKVSAGRCARVSYMTHDGKRDIMADVQLCERLVSSGHMSPMEHVARPLTKHDVENRLREIDGICGIDTLDLNPANEFCGNFRGWFQFRKEIKNEDNFGYETKVNSR